MKRTIIILGTTGLVIGLLALWQRSHSIVRTKATNTTSAPSSSPNQKILEKLNPNLAGTYTATDLARIPAEQSKQFYAKFGITTNMTPDEVKQQVFDWYRDQAQKLEAADQHPIFFYGQTVDESNRPITGANIHFSLNGGLVEKELQTDLDGNFYISDLVGKLLVIDTSKKGYYTSKSNRISFNYTNYRPNPLQPEMFRLRKKGAGIELISASLTARTPRDGTPIYIDFVNRNFGGSGQLQISQIKPPYESWKKATEWSFQMKIPDGGFIEHSDEFPFEAPEAGYRSTINFDFKANQPDWKIRLKKSYYLVFGNPSRYGEMTVETDIMWSGAKINFAINPDGSRYLEPKDSTQ